MSVLLKVITEAKVPGVTSFWGSDGFWKYLKFTCEGKHCDSSVFCYCMCSCADTKISIFKTAKIFELHIRRFLGIRCYINVTC